MVVHDKVRGVNPFDRTRSQLGSSLEIFSTCYKCSVSSPILSNEHCLVKITFMYVNLEIPKTTFSVNGTCM